LLGITSQKIVISAVQKNRRVVRRTGEVHRGLWWGNLREGDHLEDTGVGVRVILKWIFKWDGEHGLN
jgi:hypothetical protein